MRMVRVTERLCVRPSWCGKLQCQSAEFGPGVAGIKAGSRRGRKLKVLLADDAKWSQEQIDFAIKEVS